MTKLRKFTAIYRYLLLIAALLAILFGLRWTWSNLLFPLDKSHHAENGVLDLRGVDLTDSAPLKLDGQWEFYPNRLLTRAQLEAEKPAAQSIQVPGNWTKALRAGSNEADGGASGSGTYRLRILVDPLEKPMAFWLKNIQASAEIEANGDVLGRIGTVASSAADYEPRNVSMKFVYADKGATVIDLLVRAADYDSPYTGGILRSVKFGTDSALERMSGYSTGLQLLTVVLLLLHGLYACIIYLYRPKDRSLFITGLVYLSVGVAVSSGHDKTLLLWLPVNYTWILKIRLIALLWQNLSLIAAYRRFAGLASRSGWVRVYGAVLAALTAVIAASPVSVVNGIVDLNLFMAVYLIGYVWFVWTVAILALRSTGDKDVGLLLVTAGFIISNLSWSIADTFIELSSVFYPFDLLAALTIFSTYWFKKYLRNSDRVAELYERLVVADKMKDRFLANTSHELRTPLHGIMNMTSSTYDREKEKLEERSRQEMELVSAISRRMSLLLDDLLDAARLQERSVELRTEPVYVQAVVPGVLAMLSYMTEGKPVALQASIPDTLPPVLADEKRFVQIVYNLLHNALKYTEKGTIRISAEAVDGTAEIRVSDTGVGMDEETQARIFEPYVQGVYGVSDGRGIGLGLSICRQLVELHGGTLTVESAPGQGSTFRFGLALAENAGTVPTPNELSLHRQEAAAALEAYAELRDPLAAADDRQLQDALPSLLTASRIHLLAVDDDPVNLDVLRGILSTEPYGVTTAHSAGEALELLTAKPWDLVVADVMMPGMSGYELAQRIRERYSASELPVLLLTARSQPADIYTGFLAGASDYVTKPADATELKYRIRSLIALKRSTEDRQRIESAYLQAQIHPHFLFNALNSLMALSEIDTERMRALGEAFASYLRISFDYMNTGETVKLEHELELVESYLHIERERFGSRLSIVWEVDEGIRLELPPLSIQPLVENAVKHGLRGRSGVGVVRVRVVREAQGALIEVADNGIGIPPERAAELLQPTLRNKRGIGIANTNRRLIRLYGQGLAVESVPGEGTKVSFFIPLA